jgi:uncharacterized protein YfkK (UPF0435 family)
MKTRLEQIQEFLTTLNVANLDINSYASEELNSFQDLHDAIQDNNGFEVEIVYYSKAIKYLMDNDASLMDSIAIANDLGYETKNLTSELLATLLASQKCIEEFCQLEEEINIFFEELNTTL